MLEQISRLVAGTDIAGLIWFVCWWVGYSYFAKSMAKRTHSLSSVLHVHRVNWMRKLLLREVRVGDAALVANLERQVSFFASTTILILAGLLAVIPNIGVLHTLLSELSFVDPHTAMELQLRVLLLVAVFVYAFFTFTWSMRQFGFCSILVGGAPLPAEAEQLGPEPLDAYARYTAKVIDQAGHSYNYGLRAYYFSMAVLAWFLSQILFFAAVFLVVVILYRREFYSKPLAAMREILPADH